MIKNIVTNLKLKIAYNTFFTIIKMYIEQGMLRLIVAELFESIHKIYGQILRVK